MYILHTVEHGIVMHVQMAECTFSAQLSQSVYLMQCVWIISVYCMCVFFRFLQSGVDNSEKFSYVPFAAGQY